MKENQARILLVEQEPFSIWRVQDCLESRGYLVHVTNDGQRAIDLITSWQPDLIILACRMPDLNAYEICRRIREFSWVPIIMLDDLDQVARQLEGFRSGADDYVTGPFNVNELAARVRALLRRAQLAKRSDPWHLLNTRDALADLMPAAVE